MKRNDELEIQRSDARNNLEELIFETRDIIDGIEIPDNFNVKLFHNFLNVVEKWLYKHGEKCSRETFEEMRANIENFNMMGKITKVYPDFEDDYRLFVAQMKYIALHSVPSDN